MTQGQGAGMGERLGGRTSGRFLQCAEGHSLGGVRGETTWKNHVSVKREDRFELDPKEKPARSSKNQIDTC